MNLEVELNNVAVRILTSEFNQGSQLTSLPTLLLRFNKLSYTHQKEDKTIQDKFKWNKNVYIHQIALFLLNKPILSNVYY